MKKTEMKIQWPRDWEDWRSRPQGLVGLEHKDQRWGIERIGSIFARDIVKARIIVDIISSCIAVQLEHSTLL
ncbi:hypothetical protein L6164_023912 [Bauhinia variegata]|uniref:Uncharacterized protein n=1 Tax=Bauhinia variegata TaxID=167791 RepID=A0ACB9MK32_BAUVA|nr:hypothetical protein L6164_023912 [Bauhinia variegata]